MVSEVRWIRLRGGPVYTKKNVEHRQKKSNKRLLCVKGDKRVGTRTLVPLVRNHCQVGLEH